METIITDTYGTNFGTAYQTYKEAVKQYNSIILQDVTYYLGNRDDIQTKVRPKTYTSFVSPGAKFEFEIDTMDMESKGAASNARYGFVSIDYFFKPNLQR